MPNSSMCCSDPVPPELSDWATLGAVAMGEAPACDRALFEGRWSPALLGGVVLADTLRAQVVLGAGDGGGANELAAATLAALPRDLARAMQLLADLGDPDMLRRSRVSSGRADSGRRPLDFVPKRLRSWSAYAVSARWNG